MERSEKPQINNDNFGNVQHAIYSKFYT